MHRNLADGLQNIEKRPHLAWTLSILWLLFVGWIAFFWHLGSTSLIDETEPLFAEAARQMTVTGDWVTPYFNGVTRFDKPPLVYWLMATSYQTIGVNEWAVRLPSALAAMSVVCLGFYTIWSFGLHTNATKEPSKPGYWWSAAIGAALMALNPETIAWARVGVSDMLLTGCMASALLCFFIGYARSPQSKVQFRWYLAFYVLIAAAILTKGPVGIVLPGLIIISFLFYVGKFKEVWQEMRPLWGSLIICAIALPWFILVTLRNGDAYINSFFGYHNIERFTGVVNNHSAPWYFYFIVVLLGFAPWSIYLPVAIAKVKFWQRSIWQHQARTNQLSLFALFWFLGVFSFFTVAVTKLPSYVLPLMPAGAMLVTLAWSNLPSNLKLQRFFQVSRWLNIVLLVVLAVGFFLLPNLIGIDPAIPNLQQLVKQSGLPVVAGTIWALAGVGGAILLLRRQGRWLLGANLLAFIAFMMFVITPAAFLMDGARQLPLKQLSAIAATSHQPGEELIMIGFKKPSVVFYSHLPVTYIKQTDTGLDYVKKILDARSSPVSVMVLTQPQKLAGLKLSPPSQYVNLGKTGGYQLIRASKWALLNSSMN
ncbi:glycosyltransferase [Aliterella atlantica CENA595]|uniref:Glycosyltransferase n=1 Tax=Aliterella atlantica CENA595 TaxID=1618023 RepID=A0A0D8ZNN7_9CYAN|nr:glycosyltransferase family 39 protein [Aliterella atlantica]KJH70360.1 glycosyltransferase [Aliterella atlantica CENA595]